MNNFLYAVATIGEATVIRRNQSDGKVSWIPMDKSNSDYQAYLEWLAEGNEPELVEGDA